MPLEPAERVPRWDPGRLAAVRTSHGSRTHQGIDSPTKIPSSHLAVLVATVLGSSLTGPKGKFSISCTSPADPDSIRYLMADSPPAVRLASVLGLTAPRQAIVNELTPVAASHALAPFIVDGNIWSANTCNGTVTQYRGGNLIGMSSGATGLRTPMGAAVDNFGNVWVSSSAIIDMPCAGNAASMTPAPTDL